MTYGSFLYPPHIHLEQEDPLNLDEENDKIEGSALNKSWSNYITRTQDTYCMSSGTFHCSLLASPWSREPEVSMVSTEPESAPALSLRYWTKHSSKSPWVTWQECLRFKQLCLNQSLIIQLPKITQTPVLPTRSRARPGPVRPPSSWRRWIRLAIATPPAPGLSTVRSFLRWVRTRWRAGGSSRWTTIWYQEHDSSTGKNILSKTSWG